MDKETSVILRNKKDSKRIRQCRVVFSYKQDHEDELNLNVGDLIDVLGEEEEGWWRGILNGKIGVFPSNFVEEVNADKLKSSREDLNISNDGDLNLTLPPRPAKILCEVKYSYKAQNEDELNLKEGDIVTLVSKDGQDPGWWKGELNSLIGVFPDNFVVILPYSNDKTSTNENSPTITQDLFPIKPSSIVSQRKSLENKTQNHSEKIDILGHGDNKITPPVPTKKPTIAVKKSPSGSGSSGGLFSGIKKKIVDVVDGATSSKSNSSPAKNENPDSSSENVFDQVERVSLLTDVRATRVKAPAGRRPPSVVFREEESGIPNGNVEPLNLEMVSEQSGSSDTDNCEVKPRLREWEKHKAPWLAEMKLSQAKRTSPGPPENKLKITPTEKIETEETKPEVRTSKPETEMSKSLSSLTSTPLSSKVKLENEKVPLRPKPNLTNIPTPRPASIQSVSPVILPAEVTTQKPPTPAHPKISPISRTPSPSLHKELETPRSEEEEMFELTMQEDVEHYSRYNVLLIVANLLGIITVALTYLWYETYNGGFSLKTIATEFNWHPLLLVLGCLYLYAQTLICHQSVKRISRWFRIKARLAEKKIFWVNFIIKTIVFALIVLGLQTAFDYNNISVPSIRNMHTLHSWLGIIAVILFLIEFLLALQCYVFKTMTNNLRSLFISICGISSIMAFVLSICTSLLGIIENAIFTYEENYGNLSAGALLLNILGVFIIAFGIVVLEILLKGRSVEPRRSIPRDLA